MSNILISDRIRLWLSGVDNPSIVLKEYLSKNGAEIWKRFRGNGIGTQFGDREEYRRFVRRRRKAARANGETVSSSIYFQPIRVVRDEWLVHFCGAVEAKSIVRGGFKGGDISRIPYSSGRRSDSVGYNYAFLLSDIANGDDEGKNVFEFMCDSAVVFKSSGVLGYHYGDRNRQVVFYGGDVREMAYFEKGGDGDYVLKNKFGKVLFRGHRRYFGEFGEYHNNGCLYDWLCDLCEWLCNNGFQYRRLIDGGDGLK